MLKAVSLPMSFGQISGNALLGWLMFSLLLWDQHHARHYAAWQTMPGGEGSDSGVPLSTPDSR